MSTDKKSLRILRLYYLIISLSLAITSLILNLSAYLTDTDYYQGTFRTAAGSELGFKLTGIEYVDEMIIPGNTVPMDLKASVEKPNDLYLFVQLDIPKDFSQVGLNSNEWHPIAEGSNVYYYGHESIDPVTNQKTTSLVPLGTTNGSSAKVLDRLVLSTSAKNDAYYSVSITGYAIQAANISPSTDPKTVFEMIGQ